MTAYVGFVDNTMMLAHQQMLETIRDVCLAEGWTILRYDTAITNRELLMMAPGLSGTEQIFCGVYCYQDSNADFRDDCGSRLCRRRLGGTGSGNGIRVR
ncbi:hypothetical protein ACOQNP_06405 [Ectopseudomonas khazarica]|uniref:hypothetical protein n=1 Tax=Ectopseudomonas khazarica TaxID=2502979 RepID=UPI003B94C219